MPEVNISELRNHLPQYLSRVEAGEEILVIRRGRVVARLAPARDTRALAREQLAGLRKQARVDDVLSPIQVDWEAEQ
jgi:prevent-host-death family protein